MKKKYHLISLGCPKNLVDSEIFSGLLSSADFIQTEDIYSADLIIINTCGFINPAKEESVDTILEALEYKKLNGSKVIVTGCLVKRYLKELEHEIPEVDHFINLKDFKSFAKIMNIEFNPSRKLLTPKHYAYLRISDGCENFCSYCAIPFIRGKLTSKPMEELIEEAQNLANSGVKELIITAQDTALYGIDLYGRPMLSELLKQLHEIKNLAWIRLLYLHPAHLTEKLITTISALPKVLHYFDIPLQHINDDILKRMNRKIDAENTIRKIKKLKQIIPDAAIRTTFIVGFPGETFQKYKVLKDYISSAHFHRLGIFGYSPEEGTAAYNFKPLVTQKTINKRIDELMSIQQQISSDILETFIGKTLQVIIDRISPEEDFKFEGRSYLDAPEIDGTVFIRDGNAKPGDIVDVKIFDSWEYDLIGDIRK